MQKNLQNAEVGLQDTVPILYNNDRDYNTNYNTRVGTLKMLPLPQIESKQKQLLIQIVHKDNKVLINTPDAEWFRALYYFPWEQYRKFGAEYYDVLDEFNKREEKKRK